MNENYKGTILAAFNSEVYIQNQMDVQHTPIYDTVTIAAAGAVTSLTANFFTNVGPSSGKTVAQTNMTLQRRLANPEAFSIFGFRVRWSEDIVRADVTALLNQFCLTFYLGQKFYQRAPLWYFNAGGGINGFSTKTSESVYNNGQTGREAMHKLAIPIVLEQGVDFYAQLEGASSYTAAAAAAGGTGIILTLLLDGLYARGVQ